MRDNTLGTKAEVVKVKTSTEGSETNLDTLIADTLKILSEEKVVSGASTWMENYLRGIKTNTDAFNTNFVALYKSVGEDWFKVMQTELQNLQKVLRKMSSFSGSTAVEPVVQPVTVQPVTATPSGATDAQKASMRATLGVKKTFAGRETTFKSPVTRALLLSLLRSWQGYGETKASFQAMINYWKSLARPFEPLGGLDLSGIKQIYKDYPNFPTGATPPVLTPPVRTTEGQFLYRKASSKPSTPTGGTSLEHHRPTGWQTTAPSPTATLDVWKIQRTLAFLDAVFSSAQNWGTASIHERRTPPVLTPPVRTTEGQFLYRKASSKPSTPTGGTSLEHHRPTGWQTTAPSPTATLDVWKIQRTLAFLDAVFSSAQNWGTASIHERRTPPVLTPPQTGVSDAVKADVLLYLKRALRLSSGEQRTNFLKTASVAWKNAGGTRQALLDFVFANFPFPANAKGRWLSQSERESSPYYVNGKLTDKYHGQRLYSQIPKFHTGGRVKRSGPHNLLRGEEVLNPMEAYRYRSEMRHSGDMDINITVNVNGDSAVATDTVSQNLEDMLVSSLSENGRVRNTLKKTLKRDFIAKH